MKVTWRPKLVKLLFANFRHLKTQIFLDYRRWKFKRLEKPLAKGHIIYIISLICYYEETVLACYPTLKVPQQLNTTRSRTHSKTDLLLNSQTRGQTENAQLPWVMPSEEYAS